MEATADTSVITFPYNTPVQVINLDDYVNLIGGTVPSSGPALVSYNSIKLLFRNAGASLVYVVRVGGGFNVNQLSFPTVVGNNEEPIQVTNGSSLSTTVPTAGSTIYYRFYINGIGVGAYNSNGIYLGVPITLVSTPVEGSNHTNTTNAAISEAIRDQVISYIQRDPQVYSSAYIRSFSTTVDATLGHNVELSPRIIGQDLEISFNSSIPNVDALFYNPISSLVLEEITPTNTTTVTDYIQSVQTSFRSEMEQGYIAAPAAFAQFESLDREALGIAIENFCSDPDYSWLGILDPGNSDISQIELSVEAPDFNPGESVVNGDYFTYNNTVWRALDDYTADPVYINSAGNVRRVAITKPGTSTIADGTYAEVALSGGTGAKAVVKVLGGQVVRVDINGGLTIGAKTPTTGGRNYGATSGNVPLNGGSGYGAKATFTVTSGVITSFTVVVSAFEDQVAGFAGAGYKVGDVLTVDNSYFGSTGSGFSYTVTAADLQAPAAGTGYTDGSVISLGTINSIATSAEVKIYTNSILEDSGELGGTEVQFIPENDGNPYLQSGLEINGKRYSLPLRIIIPDGTFGGSVVSVSIPTANPLTPVSFAELEEALGELVRAYPTITLTDTKGIVEELAKNNKLEYYDSGVDSHSRLFSDSQKYTSPFGYIAYYGPYLIDLEQYVVPPSCGVIGVALRRGSTQGFQEPPAGAVFPVQGVLSPEYEITRQHQLASNSKGMNAIRELPGKGTVIWGARTRSDNPLFKYVNTRVILNVIIGTARSAFDTLIFSSIDGRGQLFGRIRETLEQFLYRLWQGNALFGANPKDAYRVFCDRRNNPALDLESGRVRANVYVVPVPTLEAVEIDLVRVAIDNVQNVVESEGFS